MISVPSQGQIIWSTLDPIKGHEQRGHRPMLVISNESFNRLCGGLVKIVPITTSTNEFPTHIPLPNGLAIEGKVMIQHERTIDVLTRGYEVAEQVPKEYLDKIIHLIKATY
ncbi:type II toxin-antitoxin system PemK/MazF family toxin [Limosilactobacillus ingluviei]|uniref:type II toxin-antitoxin system PemK/MazF family toxin n=1 Tax=Limosilactobacillus ingluviei TaxID=148604 RepID=UPI0023F3D53F|nr:type II toxin-antitoxin system PemK/MazF family toxin [Limosilactobacillus ingluviei]